MKAKQSIFRITLLGAGLAVALAFANGCKTDTGTGDQMKPMKGGEHLTMPK